MTKTDPQVLTIAPRHLNRLLAYSYKYRIALRYRRLRSVGTLGLAAISPLIVVFFPSAVDGLAAIAGGWLVLGRTLLTWAEDANIGSAARIQELYDTDLFRIHWNAALVGRKPSPDDVVSAAQHIRKRDRFLNWYDIDLGDTPWPADVLLCQRQSAVWARRDHRAYGIFLATAGALWLIFGLALAIGRDMTVAEYLVRLFLPSAPAYLDAADLAYLHLRHAARRQSLENNIHDLWDSRQADRSVPTSEDCRRIQDAAFQLRRSGPRVSEAFYMLRRHATMRATAAGTDELRAMS